MGTTQINMALTMFNMHNSLFPSEAGFGGFQGFRRMDRLMEQMDRQRAEFLQDMDPEPAAPEQGKPFAQSYSFSSFTSNTNGEVVTHRSENFQSSAGEKLSRSRRAIGQGESAKAIEETMKGEEQTRTLHNMEEQDVQAFNQQHAARLHWQPFHALEPRAEQPKHALHAALEQDIDRVAGCQ